MNLTVILTTTFTEEQLTVENYYFPMARTNFLAAINIKSITEAFLFHTLIQCISCFSNPGFFSSVIVLYIANEIFSCAF